MNTVETGHVGRFAPSVTGDPHLGTIVAACLAYLDGRQGGGRVYLRIDDIDQARARSQHRKAIESALERLGLDFDATFVQSQHVAAYAEALDRLGARGLLYGCACTRAQLASEARSPDGSTRYPNRCRRQTLPGTTWRSYVGSVRCILDGIVRVTDEVQGELISTIAEEFGDPVVRRRDGQFAYHLATVIDDALMDVTRVTRGRDLWPSTPIQVALQQLLETKTPTYRHHFLVLARTGEKLSKRLSSPGFGQLMGARPPAAMLGLIAHLIGLGPPDALATIGDLQANFSWNQVRRDDYIWEDQPTS